MVGAEGVAGPFPTPYPTHFPTKFISAGALFFDEYGALLLVKPTYKDGWEIPGGIVEQDESPKDGCRREITEELAIDVTPGPLLVMDYRSRKGARPESLQLVFLGGTLSPETVQTIVLPPTELSEYRFVAPEQALRLLPEPLSLRVAASLRAVAERRTLVLHDGREV